MFIDLVALVRSPEASIEREGGDGGLAIKNRTTDREPKQ